MVQQMRLFRIAAILLCTCGNIVGESELRKGESEAGVGRRAEALWTANAHTGTWTFLVFAAVSRYSRLDTILAMHGLSWGHDVG